MSEPDVKVFATLEEASAALGERVAGQLRAAVAERGQASIALSGGSTPRRLYETLAGGDVPWEHVLVLWGDERFVAHDSPASNYRMARETLLDRIEIPPENVRPIPTDLPRPKDAAAAYAAELEVLCGDESGRGEPPRIDVILLGMGEDGHTASLFPWRDELLENELWVVASRAPEEPYERVTLTLPVINSGRWVHFLVAGATKREALRCALDAPRDPQQCPASMVEPRDGTLTWWLDAEVAEGVEVAAF